MQTTCVLHTMASSQLPSSAKPVTAEFQINSNYNELHQVARHIELAAAAQGHARHRCKE